MDCRQGCGAVWGSEGGEVVASGIAGDGEEGEEDVKVI